MPHPSFEVRKFLVLRDSKCSVLVQCSGGARGVPGVLAPLDQAPRTTKNDLYKYKWWYICSFTSHPIFQSRASAYVRVSMIHFVHFP